MFKTSLPPLKNMLSFNWFIKLMKSEPTKKRRTPWVVDASKYLTKAEVKRLVAYCNRMKLEGLKKKRFAGVRNWFMVELGLNTGLRVQEMASLRHSNLLIGDEQSSITLVGKGGKKRSVLVSKRFKRKCLAYIEYKEKFKYCIDPESNVLNNLAGKEISKRALQKFFKLIVQGAGLETRYHIHNLRHTYTTFLLKSSNYNYEFVKKELERLKKKQKEHEGA